MNSNRLLISAYLSNALEFFEYTLFGALSLTIQQTFFLHVSWINPYTLTLFAFCISLLVRPIGSLLFGYIGDKISRVLSLQLSIACMTLASLTMALLPGTEIIGEAAVWIILLSRILQGISAGGEYNGAAILAIESYTHKQWTISGYLTSSALMGLVLACVAAMLLSVDRIPAYAWRIAFGFSALLGVSAFLLRRISTPAPPQLQNPPSSSSTHHKWLVFFAIFFIGGHFVSLKNALQALPQFQNVDIPTTIASMLLLASLSCIPFAKIAQNLNSTLIMRLGTLSIIFLTPLCLYLLSLPSLFISITALIVLALTLGLHGSTQLVIFQRLVPKHLRQRMISVAFSCGTGILSSLVIWSTSGLDLTTPGISILLFSLISIGSLTFITLLENRYGLPYQTEQ
jgi:MHS family proline/betaine transporter-like MFS transporter